MMYAESSPASRRNSVFDSEQSPQKNPARWSRTSSPTIASSSRSPRYGIFSPRPQQPPVRERVVEVPRDQEAVAPARAFGHGSDDVHGREPILGEAPQQTVLPLDEVVGQLLDDVRRAVAAVAELDEPDDVAVQPEHP